MLIFSLILDTNMDTEDSVFLNPESLFENRRGGRSQSLSAVPREGEGSAFMPPGMNINANDDQRGFTEVNMGYFNKNSLTQPQQRQIF